MSKFTPGPWVRKYRDRVSVPDDTNGTLSIAHIYDCKYQDANAYLIAAAPDLYEACESALSYLPAKDGKSTGEPDGDVQLMIANKLRAALKKAGGDADGR